MVQIFLLVSKLIYEPFYTTNLSCELTISFGPNLVGICSVGRGPEPTRMVYALATPITGPMADGGSPRPEHAPPTVELEDVTNG
jgi:hypothetical protein